MDGDGERLSAMITSFLSELLTYQTLYVGFSGGLDSTVLLHVLSQTPLRPKLVAVHVNHGLSINANMWALHCQRFCEQHVVAYQLFHLHLSKGASLEARARHGRYEVFTSLLASDDALLLAHHQQDQAETVLLNMMRGAGVDGLTAMEASRVVGLGVLLRPFLGVSRQTLEDYAVKHQLSYVEDESNTDLHFSRNYIRHQILPLLRARWPAVDRSLAQTAMHAADARMQLRALAEIDCPSLSVSSDVLSLTPWSSLPRARVMNVLRSWFHNLQLQSPSTVIYQRIYDELIQSAIDKKPCVQWGNVTLRRYRDALYLCSGEMRLPTQMVLEWIKFPEPLLLDAQHALLVTPMSGGFRCPEASEISVRYRQGGETWVYHGQTKTLKKCFQAWGVPPWVRDYVPLVYVNGVLAVVVGFGVNDEFYSDENAWGIIKTLMI